MIVTPPDFNTMSRTHFFPLLRAERNLALDNALINQRQMERFVELTTDQIIVDLSLNDYLTIKSDVDRLLSGLKRELSNLEILKLRELSLFLFQGMFWIPVLQQTSLSWMKPG